MWEPAYTKLSEEIAEHATITENRRSKRETTHAAVVGLSAERTCEDLVLGEAPRRSMLVHPRTNKLPGEHVLAVVKKNPTTGDFMHKGKYYAELVSAVGSHGSTSIDFVQASECMLREGQRVLLNLDTQLYAELRCQFANLSLGDNELHHALEQGEGKCQLAAYYVLGDSKTTSPDSLASTACMRVAIETDNQRKVLLFVALYSAVAMNDGSTRYTPIVSVDVLPERGPLVSGLRDHSVDKDSANKRQFASRVTIKRGESSCWV